MRECPVEARLNIMRVVTRHCKLYRVPVCPRVSRVCPGSPVSVYMNRSTFNKFRRTLNGSS